jgi:hypothetical protein
MGLRNIQLVWMPQVHPRLHKSMSLNPIFTRVKFNSHLPIPSEKVKTFLIYRYMSLLHLGFFFCLASLLTLKMEAICYSEKSLELQWFSGCCIQEGRTLRGHSCNNLTTYKTYTILYLRLLLCAV